MKILRTLFIWGGALFITIIFLDSLRFKFSGHPTPEHIFTTLREWSGIGLFYPAGPWVIGIAEAVASFLVLFLPIMLLRRGGDVLLAKSQILGGLLATGIMSGAIVFHLFTPLGIETPTEWADGEIVAQGPLLFYMACAVWVFGLGIAALRWTDAKG